MLSRNYISWFAIVWICIFSDISWVNAQSEEKGIAIDKSYTTESLVRDVFVKGSCDNVNNIISLGDPNGLGYFENGADVIGIDKGIIISTGDINGAKGPNSGTRHTGNFRDETGDRDLEFLATGKVNDAVGIEFDFVPLDSVVSFRYVFASEEYCEFVGQKFNDVFGFFISGPGINGRFTDNAENVALIPGTDDIVAINSVNHVRNKDFFEGNFRQEDVQDCNLDFIPNEKQELIEYDGFTKVLTAKLKLVPCETYHIRFVISDVEDFWFDSAVFLEAGSFNLGGEVQITTLMPNDTTNYLEEGCDEGIFVFERANPATIDIPLTVRFKVSDLSAATEGVDFDVLPDSITIPAQQMTTKLPIQFINDYKSEPNEQLILELDIPCACYTGLSELTIVDPPPLEAYLRDSTICYGEETSIRPVINNGTPPYTYQWANNSDSISIRVDPNLTQGYALTITDACSNFIVLENRVNILPVPTATISGDPIVCEGDYAYLNVRFTGNPPYSFSYAKDNSFEGTVENIGENPYRLPLLEAGTYSLLSYWDKDCEGVFSGQGTVKIKGFAANWDIMAASCHDSKDGGIAVNVMGGKPPYQYNWQDNLSNLPILASLNGGVYTVTIADSENCTRTYDIEVPAPPALQPVSFRCEDLSVGIINIKSSGGTPPYQYSVDGVNFEDKNIFEKLQPGENYQLTIIDEQLCVQEQEFLMPAPYLRMIDIPTYTDTKLGIPKTIQPLIGIPEVLVKRIEWQPD